jgi:hypothetical protein
MRAALGAPTTMADDEVRRLVGLAHACVHACMRSRRRARARPAHACAHDCAPAHACAYHGVLPFPTGARALDLARRARVHASAHHGARSLPHRCASS